MIDLKRAVETNQDIKKIHSSIQPYTMLYRSGSSGLASPTGMRARSPPQVRCCIPWFKVFLALLFLQAVALLLLHSKLESEEVVFDQEQEQEQQQQQSPLEVITNHIRHPFQQQRAPLIQSVPIRLATTGTNTNSGTTTVTATPSEHDSTYRQKVEQMELHLRQIQDSPHIRSCRFSNGVYTAEAAASSDSFCPVSTANTNTDIIYYNPLNRTRLLCGHTVPASSFLALSPAEQCHEPSRLWPVIPDVSTAVDMPPVTVRFDAGGRKVADAPAPAFTDCDIPCHSSGHPSLVATRTVDGTNWTFVFSMEGPKYYSRLAIDHTAYQQNRYYSTTSYESEVPLPYYSWAEYQIQQPALDYEQAIKGAAFLARNCHSNNNREAVVQALQKSEFRIDSMSSCLHNAEVPVGLNRSNKTAIMQHYLFYLAFENQNVDDYITEKLWGPFQAGVVPVYLGAPNVHDHAPPHSIIAVQDFNSIEELAAHLQKVANNKELYEEYQQWRTEPLPAKFHAKHDFTHIHSTCRTCRWAYAKMYGLGWNPANQSLTTLAGGNRNACLGGNGLLTRPVKEGWRRTTVSSSSVSVSLEPEFQNTAKSCPVSSKSQTLVHDGQLRRTVWQQDGVIDMLLEDTGLATRDLIWRLETLVQSQSIKMIQEGHVRLQDQQTRMTLLMLPTTGVELTMSRANPTPDNSIGNGIIDLAIQSQHLPLRLRIIIEDIDTFHRGAEKLENHFGQVMVEDFFNPIEAFVDIAQ